MIESLQIQRSQTAEAIVRTNAVLERHRQRAKPDPLAVEQYQAIKNDLTQQLLVLLRELTINLPLAA